MVRHDSLIGRTAQFNPLVILGLLPLLVACGVSQPNGVDTSGVTSHVTAGTETRTTSTNTTTTTTNLLTNATCKAACTGVSDFVLSDAEIETELKLVQAKTLPGDGKRLCVRYPVTAYPAKWGKILSAASWKGHTVPLATCAEGTTNCGNKAKEYVPFVSNAEPVALGLSVTGSAEAWSFEVTTTKENGDVLAGSNTACPDESASLHTTVPLNDTTGTINSTTTNGTTNVPLMAVANHILDGKWNITVCPSDLSGAPVSGAPCCVVGINSISPLVIDFSGQAVLQTLSLLDSNVFFDIGAEGMKRHTGWIGPKSAFLALDLNGNGKIDDGGELFGDATLLAGGVRAANGFEALRQYDVGRKGYIDSTDPVFSKLRLWADTNQDGKSQPSELKTLEQAGIRRIPTSYESVPRSLQDGTGNIARYRASSRASGTGACAANGCPVYDVYFQARSETIVTSR